MKKIIIFQIFEKNEIQSVKTSKNAINMNLLCFLSH